MKSTVLRLAIALLSFAMFVTPAQAAYVPAAAATTTTTDANTELALKNAVKESWTSLSRAERKSRISAAKDALKNMNGAASDKTALAVILAILIPFVGVWYYEGKFTNRVLIALLLSLLFYIPGLIYALVVILGKG